MLTNKSEVLIKAATFPTGNEKGSNERAQAGQVMEVFRRFLRPGAANCSSVLTPQMTKQTDDVAVGMPVSEPLLPPVTPQVSTAETDALSLSMTNPRRHDPPTGSIAGMADKAFELLAAVVLIVLFGGIMVWLASLVRNANKQQLSRKCVLPAYPEHGTYEKYKPGESFESLHLTVTCDYDYGVLGEKTVYCDDGSWSDPIPQCIRFCKLDMNPSVHYHCPVTGSTEGRRVCNAHEPEGTVARPECNSPIYYSIATLPSMRCINGSWDYVAVCSPDCGRVTRKAVPLVIDGKSAEPGELPWHVGIYRKNKILYKQICGGSIITNRVVISAAHCFWKDQTKQPASMFAVAAGKIYRPWNNSRDINAQKSDVKDIKIPDCFQGAATNFQADIAILILDIAFVYNAFVRPICLNFDAEFDNIQLQPGLFGKVSGWGLTAANGNYSQILKVIDLPFLSLKECYAASPPDFKMHITTDKFCAGYMNGTAVCQGDSGGGLAFCEFERGKHHCYLRGIVSTAPKPNNEDSCNSETFTTYTRLLNHEQFIRANT